MHEKSGDLVLLTEVMARVKKWHGAALPSALLHNGSRVRALASSVPGLGALVCRRPLAVEDIVHGGDILSAVVSRAVCKGPE